MQYLIGKDNYLHDFGKQSPWYSQRNASGAPPHISARFAHLRQSVPFVYFHPHRPTIVGATLLRSTFQTSDMGKGMEAMSQVVSITRSIIWTMYSHFPALIAHSDLIHTGFAFSITGIRGTNVDVSIL